MSIREYYGRLKSSTLIRSVALLSGGTAAGQAVLWAATPFLTRLYTPGEYGMLGVFLAVAGLVSLFSTFRYEQAIILERDPKVADQVFALCVFVSIGFLIAAITVTALYLYGVNDDAGALSYVIWAPFLAAAMGFRVALNLRAIAGKKFKSVAFSDVFQTTTSVTIQLVAGIVGMGAAGLIAGPVASVAVAAVILGVLVLYKDPPRALARPDFRALWGLAKRHYRFPLFSLPTSLLDRFSKQMPVLLLAGFFGSAEAGYFWLSYRLLLNPVRLLASRSRKVYYERAAHINHEKKSLAPLFTKATLALTILPAIPTVIFAIYAVELFEFVFGENWSKAGEYAQWLCVVPISTLAVIPSVEVAPIYNKQANILTFRAIQTVLAVLSLSIGAIFFTDLIAIALFSVVTASSNFLIVGYFWRLVSNTGASGGSMPIVGLTANRGE